MKVILKEDVESLGKMGDTVSVSDGYARNFLIPKGLCIEASNKNVKVLEHERKLIEKKLERQREQAKTLSEKLKAVSVTIPMKVGEQDKLFGSVTSKDIEKALAARGVEVNRRNIMMEEPIRSLGEFRVKIKLHPEVFSEVSVVVTGEEDVI